MRPFPCIDLEPGDPDFEKGYLCRMTDIDEVIASLALPQPRIEMPYSLLEQLPGGLCRMTLLPGYAWNWASIPILSRWKWYRTLAPYWYRGSGHHDDLYQAIKLGLLPRSCRDDADRIMLELIKADGSPWWRRGFDWVGVRLFGGFTLGR